MTDDERLQQLEIRLSWLERNEHLLDLAGHSELFNTRAARDRIALQISEKNMSMDRDDFESEEAWLDFLSRTSREEVNSWVEAREHIGILREEVDRRKAVADAIDAAVPSGDKINREPVDHYATPGGIETIDFIKSLGWLEQFSLANAIKYISRAGRKGGNSKLGDLKKARTYIDFVIQELENGETE